MASEDITRKSSYKLLDGHLKPKCVCMYVCMYVESIQWLNIASSRAKHANAHAIIAILWSYDVCTRNKSVLCLLSVI